eukprot:14215694-Alexandrium_andersonii.AAC.1
MLRVSFCEARPTACGPDGWAAEDIKGLPDVAFVHLARMLSCIEAGAEWPKRMCAARGAVLPKAGGPLTNPMDLRLLSITSCIYRRWAALRLGQLGHWQAAWRLPAMVGVTGGPSADTAAAALSAEIA